jgi:hypothetical protein
MNKTELKSGDIFFVIETLKIREYSYLCPHPDGSKYHIVIDEATKVPVRWSKNELEIWNLNRFDSRIDANLALADMMEDKAKTIRDRVSKMNQQK